MLNLIRTEIYKLRRQKLIVVLLAAVVALSAFSAFSEINLLTAGHPAGGRESFANAFQDVFMLFIIALFAGFYIGSDFTNRTIQSELSGGHGRLEILLSKAVVFSAGAGLLMLLYPVTVCVIHTVRFGWGELFGVSSVYYLLRVAFLGSILNMGTACIYVCFAFLCRDVPKTICVCIAYPMVFSAVSGILGRRAPLLGRLLDYSTLSQLKYIVGDTMAPVSAAAAVLSACVTAAVALTAGSCLFARAEIR